LHLSDHIGNGKLIIANRTRAHAEALAAEIIKLKRQALAVDETEIPRWAPQVALIVNSTTKGQGGVRKQADGTATMLAPYSALAPASPPILTESAAADFEKQWYLRAQADIEANNRASLALARSIPQSTRFYDLIYHPAETVFLHHAAESGHRAMNGQSMIVRQAALAFCKRICLAQLTELGKDNDATFQAVTEVMFNAW
jgi:shikimate 5-dehydrogenase